MLPVGARAAAEAAAALIPERRKTPRVPAGAGRVQHQTSRRKDGPPRRWAACLKPASAYASMK